MNVKLSHFFRPPEVFILITILALLVTLATIIVRESSKAVRDVERKEEINRFYGAVEDFKKDFGFYPNYTMVLGVGADRSKNANYDLASPISVCPDYKNWAVGSDGVTPQSDLNKAYLKPGFTAVSQFLKCLGYLAVVETDPLWSETVADYHYRVSYDYQKIVVQATTERSGLLWLGNGLGDKNLADDSDAGGFEALANRSAANSRYLYQCRQSADGKLLKASERSSVKYAPYIQDQSLNWVANPACRDKLDSLLVVSSR
jgi:hypothetical protein